MAAAAAAKAQVNNINRSKINNTHTNTNTQVVKTIPVITTFNIEISTFVRTIENALGHKNFSANILGRRVTNLSVCTLRDFERLKTLLTEHKVQFYTHPVKGSKPHMVVISRLTATFDIKEVEDHINGLDMSVTVIGVTKMGGNRWLIKLSMTQIS